jgi:hypothetical protein
MTTTVINAFLLGIMATLSCVVALLFWRYYRKSRDRLFVFMTLTFVCLAANFASIVGRAGEAGAAYFYLPRLAAFLFLLIGIIDKNRRSK